MRDTEAAWLACAIDGEGYLSKRDFENRSEGARPWPQVFVGVTNSHRGFIEKACRLLGSSSISVHKAEGKAPGGYSRKKPMYHTTVSGHEKVLAALESVLPYLEIKKEKAMEMTRFIRGRAWGRLSPEGLNRRREATKRSWLDPNRRSKTLAALKACWNNPDFRRRHVEGINLAWMRLTPQRRSETVKKGWETRRKNNHA